MSVKEIKESWRLAVAKYSKPFFWSASWQIGTSVGAYILTWVAIYFALDISWWLILPLAVLAAGLLMRIFIIFHDCGHGSFFKSRKANDAWGFITGLFTFTPYHHWRWQHAIHHRTSGNLDRRGMGDIWTLTVQEYLDSSRWTKLSYRLIRNPIVLFVIAPPFEFVLRQRFASPKAPKRERHSVWAMNIAIVASSITMSLIFGFFTFAIIQVAIMSLAGAAGIWMFYVQHQFDGVHWERADNWDYVTAAIKGSSFYKLPKILQWFTGNIGFHHIHHLNPSIPNYNLERCHKSDPLFLTATQVTLFSSLKSLRYRLWDEASSRLIGFRELKKL